jgi:hypothetical protein
VGALVTRPGFEIGHALERFRVEVEQRPGADGDLLLLAEIRFDAGIGQPLLPGQINRMGLDDGAVLHPVENAGGKLR